MKSSNCCNKYVTVRHSSHTTTANSMVDWTPVRPLLALQQLYKKVKFYPKFPWLSSHFAFSLTFPDHSNSDLFQFSLTCRNPETLLTTEVQSTVKSLVTDVQHPVLIRFLIIAQCSKGANYFHRVVGVVVLSTSVEMTCMSNIFHGLCHYPQILHCKESSKEKQTTCIYIH